VSARLTKSAVEEAARRLGYDLYGPAGGYMIIKWNESGSYRVVQWPYSGTLAEAMTFLRGVEHGKALEQETTK
jgi:hypothetical protein